MGRRFDRGRHVAGVQGGGPGSVGADALDGVSGVIWSYIGSFLPGSVVTCERLMPGGWSDRLVGFLRVW